MAGRKHKAARTGNAGTHAIPERFRTWSWGDFEDWTDPGSVERGKEYVDSVSDPGMASDGRIVATVSGRHEYATAIRADPDGTVHGYCSCPVGYRCKHTVALILKCIGMMEEGLLLPSLDDDDWRLEELEGEEDGDWDDDEDNDWEDDEDGDEDEDDDEDDEEDAEEEAPEPKAGDLEAWVDSLAPTEAKRLLKSIIAEHRDVRGALQRRLRNQSADVSQLLDAARRELAELSAHDDYSWYGGPAIPDCTKLRAILRELRARKAGPALADFGQAFADGARERIECTDDDGESQRELSTCMDIIAAAVREAPGMSETEKLRWFADMAANDDYDLLDEADAPCKNPGQWSTAAWSALADDLARRLPDAPPGDDCTSSYRRDCLLKTLCAALENAGRSGEARDARIAHFLREGRAGDLAKLYLAEGDSAAAWNTAARAAAQAPRTPFPSHGDSLSALRDILRDIARKRGDPRLALALQAEDFFADPSAHRFRELLEAAAPAGLAEAIRPHLVHFLETGTRPESAATPSAARRRRAVWPLPPSGIPENPPVRSPGAEDGPEILLQIALDEKNPDDILARWNAFSSAPPPRTAGLCWVADPRGRYRLEVADALFSAHPAVSLSIWETALDKLLPRIGRHSYEEDADLLVKIRNALARLGRSADWPDRIRQIRERYRNRRLFLEIIGTRLDAPDPATPIYGSTRKRHPSDAR